jgi:hypothetical protein
MERINANSKYYEPTPPLPRDQRKIDADHLNLPAIFHFVGAGLAVSARSAAVLGGGSAHRPGARFWNWRRDAAATRRRGRLRYE